MTETLRVRRRSPLAVRLTVVVLVLLAGSWLLWRAALPLVEVEAGPVSDALSLVEIEGARHYRSRGALLVTTVLVGDRLRLQQAVEAWLDPERDVVARERYFPGGSSPQEQAVENATAMAGSREAAVIAALRLAGRVDQPVPAGAEVAAVYPDGPSSGLLEPGDVIVSIDGRPVMSPADLRGLREEDRPIMIGLADGHTVSVRGGSPRHPEDPGFGVRLLPAHEHPVHVELRTGPIGGPSAGLALALAIVDALGPEDLTGGRRVAVTGTLDIQGRVGPVGGIRQKVAGARKAGAALFLVPMANLAEAERAAGSSAPRVVGVASLADAVEALSQAR